MADGYDQIDYERDTRHSVVNDLLGSHRPGYHNPQHSHMTTAIDLAFKPKRNKVNKTKQLKQELDNLKSRAEELERKIELLSKFPIDDPCVDGQVINFAKRFPHSSVKYSYAAIRINGRYYLSGPSQAEKAMTWGELTDWMGDGVDQIYLMTNTKGLL